MKILNLVYPKQSDIKYRIDRFPDGQQQVVIGKIKPFDLPVTSLKIKIIQIKARLNNFLDLELIICAVASLRTLGVKEIHLYTPYFLGSRSDRQFEEGSNNYLKHVICPIINSLEFSSVTVLDPHSHVLEACLNNFKKVDNLNLVRFAIRDLYNFDPKLKPEDKYILLSPDAGASHKIYKLTEQIGYQGHIIICSKERDIKGKLSKTIVPKFDWSKDVIIIDDIGDRFGTFINIAKTIKEFRKFSSSVHLDHYGKLYLIVTHSIQEEGIKEALKYFDVIYSTNSVKDFNIKNFKQINVF